MRYMSRGDSCPIFFVVTLASKVESRYVFDYDHPETKFMGKALFLHLFASSRGRGSLISFSLRGALSTEVSVERGPL